MQYCIDETLLQKLSNTKKAEYFDYLSAKISFATMHNKNASKNSAYRKGELEICLQTAMVLTKVVTCHITNKSCELQLYIQKLSFAIVAYKSCHLLLLHTKAIAALTHICDFYSCQWLL